MTRLLGVSSSQRAASHSRRLLERLLHEASAFDAETRLLDLRATPLPMYRPDAEPGEAARVVRELVLWADAIVLATPDYHGGMSAPIKNFLDHFWHEFAGKLFGYIVASHEKGLTVQDQLRTAVRQCYAWSLPYGIGFHGGRDTDRDSAEPQPPLAQRVRMMARDLVVYGALLRRQFLADVAGDPTVPTFAARFRAEDDGS